MTELGQLELDALRQRRHAAQQLEDAVSYTRRVAQGRADLVRAELAARADGGHTDPTPNGLRNVLADRLLGEAGRPPRPAADHSEHPLAVELDAVCTAHAFGRFTELDVDELQELVGALDGFEQRVSAQRQELFVEVDALTDELVRRLAEGGSP